MTKDRIENIAGVVLRDKKDRYLLVQEKQAYVYGLWNWPAGHVERSETLEEAAVRETLEEVGLKVKIIDPKPLYTGRGNRKEHLVHSFLGEIVDGKIVIQEDEILDAKWFTLDEIKQLEQESKLRGDWILSSISEIRKRE